MEIELKNICEAINPEFQGRIEVIFIKMRDINVTKYRKSLVYLQNFCIKAKRSGLGFLEKNGILRSTPMNDRITKRKNLTDFERGYIQGKHSAFNDVLIELHKMIEYADIDWENTHCREENEVMNYR